MSHQLIVYALGHHFDDAKSGENQLTAVDHAINSILSVLDDADKARTNQAIGLCRRYGHILSWCRKQQTNWTNSSSTAFQMLGARIEEILLGQLISASRQEGLSDIYAFLWDSSVLLDLAEQCLVDKQDLNSLLFHLQQEIFPEARVLYQDWLHLQLQLWTRWVTYGYLPHNRVDFWIASEVSSEDSFDENSEKMSVWDSYVLVESRLPPLMPIALAEKVLFLGKAVRVLSDAGMMDGAREEWLSERVLEIFGVDPTEVTATPPILSWNSLEATVKVDAISTEIVKSLHNLLANEHKLTSHLTVLRQFALLQNGYFFHLFIERTEAMMHAKPTINSERDVNLLWKEIGAEVIDDDATYSLFGRMSLSFTTELHRPRRGGLAEAARGYDKWYWTDLHLIYEVKGPLALVLSPPILKTYDSMFQFLFHVRRVQTSLNRLWTQHRKRLQVPHSVWLLRAKMSYFVDHLAGYLQVDVVAYQSNRLEEKISSAQTLSELQRAHEEFVQEVSAQCFLQSLPVKKVVKELIEICDTFCKAIHDMIYEGEFEPEMVQSLERDFDKKTKFAFTVLNGLRGQALYLSKFLLMLDFNEHFSGGLDESDDM